MPRILIAHSRHKSGFTAYSFEDYGRDYRGNWSRAGFHLAGGDTLDEAMAEIHKAIRQDWHGVAEIPPIVDCGKVSHATGKNWLYRPKGE